MPEKASGKKAPGNRKNNASGSRFLRRILLCVVYLLAAYGLHNVIAECSDSYRNKSREYVQSAGRQISSGARSVENSLAPHPAIVIKSFADLANSPYDNLKMGVPSFQCDIIVDRVGYALGYSEKYEQPLWVTYNLTADEVKSKKARRSDDFRSDPDIPTGSATPEDYKKSYFDRGHLAPAADMSFSLQAMSESFYMSNMSPQRAEFNRGIWKKLEEKVRDYAVACGSLYVVSGPIFDTDTPCITIGRNKVSVPDKYYKVLLDTNTAKPKAIAFVIDNRAAKQPLSEYAVTVDAVEAMTGLDFFSELDPADERYLELRAVGAGRCGQAQPPVKKVSALLF